ASVRISDAFYGLILRLTRGLPVRLAVAGGLMLAAVGVSWLLMPQRDYLPAGNQNLLMGMILPPPGYNVEEYRSMAHHAEAALSPWWSVDTDTPEGRAQLEPMQQGYMQMMQQQVLPGMKAGLEQEVAQLRAAGKSQRDIDAATSQTRAIIASLESGNPPPAIDNFFFVNYLNFVFMGASSRDPSNVAPLGNLLTGSLQGIPGTQGFFFQAPIFPAEGFASGNSITLKVVGTNNDQVTQAAGAVMGKLIEVFNTFPQPDPANFNLGRPELRIEPDRERAGLARVPETSVRTMSRVAVDGEIVGDYRYGGRAIDLTVVTNLPRNRAFTGLLADVP